MKIGTVKEVKSHEYRVGLTPTDVKNYRSQGHDIYVQRNAGVGAGYSSEEYKAQGAIILDEAKEIFDACQMIIKVKEPQPEEFLLFHEGQILFTYLHLASDKPLTEFLMKKRIAAVAYETIEDHGRLPCLTPMSEIAGRLSIQEGAKYLERPFGGRGVLLGGVPGVRRGEVTIIGGGVVGMNAAKIALGMGAKVTVIDISGNRLAYLDDIFRGQITTLYSTENNIAKTISRSDLVVGAVLVPGYRAPCLIRKEHLSLMNQGAVLVDVAVDQGGCMETTKPTTHDDPIYFVEGISHYCVTNMPGAVSRTATVALTNTTLKYGLFLASHGVKEACRLSEPLRKGLNIYDGHCVCPGVAEACDLPLTKTEDLIQ